MKIQTYYKNYNLAFSSKSKLYKYLRAEYYSKPLFRPPAKINIDAFAIKIIQLDFKNRASLDTGFSFRD